MDRCLRNSARKLIFPHSVITSNQCKVTVIKIPDTHKLHATLLSSSSYHSVISDVASERRVYAAGSKFISALSSEDKADSIEAICQTELKNYSYNCEATSKYT